jgi:hypothetical protein
MKTRAMHLIVYILLIAGLFWPLPTTAQAPVAEIVIIHTAAEAQPEGLALHVFFTLVDPGGRPIPKNDYKVEWANVELLGRDLQPVDAKVLDPQTPFYIVLLIDSSGSMAKAVVDAVGKNTTLIDEVREAAKAAIDSAPPNAVFSVIRFAELGLEDELRPIEDFTDDHELVRRAIDAIEISPPTLRDTCLYNALYKAVESLDGQAQGPQQRKAIIVFTDGEDTCSQRNYDDVIVRATRNPASITSIHTIGLCTNEQCSNIDATTLEKMALQTSAFSATGGPEELPDMFREIMGSLNSQWMARVGVLALQGENQAVLRVKLSASDSPLLASFKFDSPTAYAVPLPPPMARFEGVTYHSEDDRYEGSIQVTSPELIWRIIVELYDTKGGTQILPSQTFENPESAVVQFERNSEGLQAGRQYKFRLKAVDKEEFWIQNEKGDDVLSEWEVTYEPLKTPFSVRSVVVDSQTGQLTVDLDVTDPDQFKWYAGYVDDKESNQKIYEFGPKAFSPPQIQETLPVNILPTDQERSYLLHLTLTTNDNEQIGADAFEVLVKPPPRPSLWARVRNGLANNPWIPVAIGVIALCLAGVFLIRSQPVRQQPLPPPRPPVVKTEVFEGPAAPAQPKTPGLRLKVVQTPDRSQAVERVVTEFPCVIGRNPGCHVQIGGDKQVSGRHAEIVVSGNEFFIMDLSSTNGTFIGDNQLKPNTKTPLTGRMQVRLGHFTHLLLEPQA